MITEIKKNKTHKNNTFFSKCLFTVVFCFLYLEQKSDTTKDPFGRLLLGFEVEGPNKCWTSLLGLVHRTLIDISCLHSVDGDCLDEYNRHSRSEFLQSRFTNHTGLCIPSGSLHEKTMDVGTFTRRSAHVFTWFLCHVTLQSHLIQRPLVLTGHLQNEGAWSEIMEWKDFAKWKYCWVWKGRGV